MDLNGFVVRGLVAQSYDGVEVMNLSPYTYHSPSAGVALSSSDRTVYCGYL